MEATIRIRRSVSCLANRSASRSATTIAACPDFGIPAFGVGTGIVEFGTEKSVTFKVPDNPSDATYTCTPHSAMMSGRIFFAK